MFKVLVYVYRWRSSRNIQIQEEIKFLIKISFILPTTTNSYTTSIASQSLLRIETQGSPRQEWLLASGDVHHILRDLRLSRRVKMRRIALFSPHYSSAACLLVLVFHLFLFVLFYPEERLLFVNGAG